MASWQRVLLELRLLDGGDIFVFMVLDFYLLRHVERRRAMTEVGGHLACMVLRGETTCHRRNAGNALNV